MTEREAVQVLERRAAHLSERIREARNGVGHDKRELSALKKAMKLLRENSEAD